MTKVFSRYLDLPNLPNLGTKWDDKNIQYQYLSRPDQLIKQVDGTYLGCTTYMRYAATQAYINWFFEQIPELKYKSGDIGWQIHRNDHNNPNGIQMPVHADGPRGPFVISYMLSKGSESAITSWYKEYDQPLERQPAAGQHGKGISYDQLQLLESLEIELNKWILFRSDVLHDVKPIMTQRLCFTVGFFDKDLYSYISEKYGVKTGTW